MQNINVNLDGLNLNDLKSLLKEVRLYRDLKKSLGIRWQKLYDKIRKNNNIFQVEYFPAISEDLAWEQSKEVYSRIFSINDISREKVTFIPKELLKWGIRVYIDDYVADLSYEKVEKLIKK